MCGCNCIKLKYFGDIQLFEFDLVKLLDVALFVFFVADLLLSYGEFIFLELWHPNIKLEMRELSLGMMLMDLSLKEVILKGKPDIFCA